MSSPDNEPSTSSRRAVCQRCARPQSVCLCPALPAESIRLSGLVVVLQHPAEQHRRLATVPVLQRCLSKDCLLVLRKRRLAPGVWPNVDALVEGARQGRWPLFVMYPGPGVQDLDKALAEYITEKGLPTWPPTASQSPTINALAAPPCTTATALETSGGLSSPAAKQQPACTPPAAAATAAPAAQDSDAAHMDADAPAAQHSADMHAQPAQQLPPPSTAQPQQPPAEAHTNQPAAAATAAEAVAAAAVSAPDYVLLVFDGTWQEAREMFQHSKHWLVGPENGGTRVQLPVLLEKKQKPQPPWRQQKQQQRQQQEQEEQEPFTAADSTSYDTSTSTSISELQPETGDTNCRLRTEPFEGCNTTMEAVARALEVLEPTQDLKPALLAPLLLMTQHQAKWDPALRARLERPVVPRGRGSGATHVARSKTRMLGRTGKLPL